MCYRQEIKLNELSNSPDLLEMFLFHVAVQAFLSYFPVFFFLGGVILGTFFSGNATLQTIDGSVGDRAWPTLVSSAPSMVALAVLEYAKAPFVGTVANDSAIVDVVPPTAVSSTEILKEVNFHSKAPTPIVSAPSVTFPNSSGQEFWQKTGGSNHGLTVSSSERVAAPKPSIAITSTSERSHVRSSPDNMKPTNSVRRLKQRHPDTFTAAPAWAVR